MNIYLLILLFLFGGHSDSLKSRMDKFLSEYLRDYSRFEYEIIAGPQSGSKEIIIDHNREVRINGNTGYVPVLLMNSKGEKTQAVVSLKLKLYKTAAIALKDIKRGQDIQPGDIAFRIVDVAQVRGSQLNDTSKLLSYRAKANIEKNEIVLVSMLEKVPVIKRGDNITACVIKGNVIIEVDATARQDGSENEIISVISSDKKTFKARVLNRYSAIIVE